MHKIGLGTIVTVILYVVVFATVAATALLNVLPNTRVAIPFDFVSISFLLTGLLIIAAVIDREFKELIFDVARMFAYSALSFIIFYTAAPFAFPAAGITSSSSMTEILVFVVFSFGWIIGSFFFSMGTFDILEMVAKKKEPRMREERKKEERKEKREEKKEEHHSDAIREIREALGK